MRISTFALVLALFAFIGVSRAARADASISLTLKYAGSTQSDLTQGQIILGNMLTPDHQFDLAWRHYYSVYAEFHPDATGQYFRSVTFDLTPTGSVQFISRLGSADPTSAKWAPSNPVNPNFGAGTFESNSDTGLIGDLRAVSVLQTDAGIAIDSLTGAPSGGTLLGRFALVYTNSGPGSVNVSLSNGGSFSYFVNQPSDPISPTVNSSSFVVITQVPEPASLILLGAGTLSLLRRRHTNRCAR